MEEQGGYGGDSPDGHLYCGMYAEIAAPGAVAVGDAVTPV